MKKSPAFVPLGLLCLLALAPVVFATGEHAHDDHEPAVGGHGKGHDHGDDDPREEGRVPMADDVAAAGGVSVAVAGPRDLKRTLKLTGRIGIPSHRIVTVTPRFDGVVREARGAVGERVQAGTRLAEVDSSTTLARFAVDAPISGAILDRRAVAGAVVHTDDTLYVVADLSEVWADLDVFGKDTNEVRVGETVTVRADTGAVGAEATARIDYVSPLRDVHTQTMLARAILPNGDGRWAPGAFVSARLDIDEADAAVAVPVSALQSWRNLEVVFVHVGNLWEARPVTLGRRGEHWVEVVAGLEPGTEVATGNTFLLRAEIEKEGASHDH